MEPIDSIVVCFSRGGVPHVCNISGDKFLKNGPPLVTKSEAEEFILKMSGFFPQNRYQLFQLK